MNTQPEIMNLLPRQSVAIAQRRVSDHLRRIVKSTRSLLRVANHIRCFRILARGSGASRDVVLHAAVIIGWQANADRLPETLRVI
ncbi:MAG: hypothetical protein LKE81_07415 [Acetobacter sp.]|nr:hypothetical protein [Acetobacter sp.]MCH4061234.1 hypothetical protein [Acetobacter sp.]MCH4088171.1 hypothetical protein [Acetobacter sp.]MCI1294571.1 hypothetical protein [Acetobacter sp.]MCI1374558.1 hypothetical protein [Acetobacter sp.]